MKTPTTPPWAQAIVRPRTQSLNLPVQEVASTNWLLPTFQRGETWTPKMQAAFCNAVLVGDPIPPVLLWERPEGTWVLDGQQRLTAMGAKLVRPHVGGKANSPSQAFLDALRGEFSLEQRHWSVTLARASTWHTLPVAATQPKRNIREWTWIGYANQILRKRRLNIVTLDRNATMADAARAFRAINTPGVPIQPAELDRLLAAIG